MQPARLKGQKLCLGTRGKITMGTVKLWTRAVEKLQDLLGDTRTWLDKAVNNSFVKTMCRGNRFSCVPEGQVSASARRVVAAVLPSGWLGANKCKVLWAPVSAGLGCGLSR